MTYPCAFITEWFDVAAISEGKFYEAFRDLGDRLEHKIDERANRLERKMADHEAGDTIVANRVLVLETAILAEQRYATKQRAFIVLGLTAAATTFWKLIDYFWKP